MIQPETGAIWHVFPEVPFLAIAVFDVGGTVDTVAFHRSIGTGSGRSRRLFFWVCSS